MNFKLNVKKLVQTSLMIALSLVFQIGFTSFAQPVVGPLVNMVLMITAALISPISAVIVGVITPLVAFLVGLMPMFPLVPIIMIGNGILVAAFSYCYHQPWMKYGEYYGVIVAALFKFLFLTTAVRYLLPLVIPKVPAPLVVALGFAQFITATIGGIIALIVIKSIKSIVKN